MATASDKRAGTRFVERRAFSTTFIAMLLVAVAAGTFAMVEALLESTPTEALGRMLVFFAACVVLLLLIALGPFGVERRHIRVDGSGLRLGWGKFLPADEIGECTVVSEGEARIVGWYPRCRGVKVNWMHSSYNPISSKGPAVLVVQERARLRRPGWLIATQDPQGLLKALTELRREVKETAARDRG